MAKRSLFTVQTRKPGRAYRTVGAFVSADTAAWAFRQFLVPAGALSVRVVDANGKVVARALPRER